jgi:hypothetical protein
VWIGPLVKSGPCGPFWIQERRQFGFDLLGRESSPTLHVPTIDGFGEGGYCRVVEACVIKID